MIKTTGDTVTIIQDVAVENVAKKKKRKNSYAIAKKKKMIATKTLDVVITNMVMEWIITSKRFYASKPRSNYAFWYILETKYSTELYKYWL